MTNSFDITTLMIHPATPIYKMKTTLNDDKEIRHMSNALLYARD